MTLHFKESDKEHADMGTETVNVLGKKRHLKEDAPIKKKNRNLAELASYHIQLYRSVFSYSRDPFTLEEENFTCRTFGARKILEVVFLCHFFKI